MRFRHPDGSVVHLSYCTNVHPAETLDGVRAQLRDHCEPVRRRLGRDRLGIGLWLARDAARALTNDPAELRALRAELDPGASKWSPSTASRTRGSAPTRSSTGSTGRTGPNPTASPTPPTWPASWPPSSPTTSPRAPSPPSRSPGAPLRHRPRRPRTARTALTTLAQRLDALAELTGKSIRVGLEPEPGCTVETTADAIAPLTDVGHERIGICVDTCHLATSFEDPDTALDALTAAGIPVVKSQLSAALHAEHPHLPEVRTALAAFAEPRFLHQTRTRTAAGLRGTDDLDEAIAGGALPDSTPGAPTSTYRCTRRPRPRSPPRSPCSARH